MRRRIKSCFQIYERESYAFLESKAELKRGIVNIVLTETSLPPAKVNWIEDISEKLG